MYKNKPIIFLIRLFEKLREKRESTEFMRLVAAILVISYIGALILIGLKQLDFFKDYLYIIPDNPFKSIEMAFTLLLFFEVISLVFSIEKSISKSMSIQLEILSLILLRSAFEVFGEFYESMDLITFDETILYMLADAFSALLIFIGIIVIKRIEKPLPSHLDISILHRFINIKRLISLSMLFVFGVMIILEIIFFILQKNTFEFFKEFYTILIFTDILIVFVSLRYSNNYIVLFRNSSYAFATVMIRIALSSAAPYNALLGLVATIFIIGIVLAYNKLNFQKKY